MIKWWGWSNPPLFLIVPRWPEEGYSDFHLLLPRWLEFSLQSTHSLISLHCLQLVQLLFSWPAEKVKIISSPSEFQIQINPQQTLDLFRPIGPWFPILWFSLSGLWFFLCWNASTSQPANCQLFICECVALSSSTGESKDCSLTWCEIFTSQLLELFYVSSDWAQILSLSLSPIWSPATVGCFSIKKIKKNSEHSLIRHEEAAQTPRLVSATWSGQSVFSFKMKSTVCIRRLDKIQLYTHHSPSSFI